MRRWRWLGELAAVVAVIVAAAVVGSFWMSQAPMQDRAEPPPTVDFIQFYALGYATAQPTDRHALESDDAWRALVERLVPWSDRYPRLYGPHVGLIFAPFSKLPLFQAYLIWNLFSLAAFGASVWWLVSRYAQPLAPLHFWIVTGTLAFPPLAHTLISGHVSVLAVVPLVIAIHGFSRRSAWLAGLGVGLLAWKPTLFVPVLAVTILAGEIAVAAVAIAVAAAMLFITVPALGFGPLQAYIATLVAAGQSPGALAKPELMCSLLTFWHELLPAAWAGGLYVVTAAATVIAAGWGWRRTADPLQRVGLASVATVLATPHFLYYDLVIITPAIVTSAVWLRDGRSPRTWLQTTTWAAYFALATAPLVLLVPIHAPTLIVAAWFVVMLSAWTRR